MKIAIIGSGGVGGYFGGRLAKAGFNVSFLARAEHLKAMKENGLTVKSTLGDFHIENVNAFDNINSIGQSDLILLAVKAWQTQSLLKDLKKIIAEDGVIIPLQNGVMTVDELKEEIDPKHILGGLCRIMSAIEAPGVINHSGINPTIVFGEVDGTKTERLEKIKEIFDKSGINSKIADDINSELWKKFIAICVSGLLAVSRTTYGEMRELRETRELMFELLNEIYQLSQRMRINIEADFLEKTLSFIDSYPADSISSLTRDVWEGRPSEIEYQNGAVVKLARKYSVFTPVNRFIYNCILPMELKARAKAKSEIKK